MNGKHAYLLSYLLYVTSIIIDNTNHRCGVHSGAFTLPYSCASKTPPAVPSSPSSWHLNDSTYSLPICTATGIWEISALCKARQMAGICCSMLRTDWPPLAANPCVGVRAQVIIIKDTNKTHQHVALSHVGKKKKSKNVAFGL